MTEPKNAKILRFPVERTRLPDAPSPVEETETADNSWRQKLNNLLERVIDNPKILIMASLAIAGVIEIPNALKHDKHTTKIEYIDADHPTVWSAVVDAENGNVDPRPEVYRISEELQEQTGTSAVHFGQKIKVRIPK
jgi:hypothetical protein